MATENDIAVTQDASSMGGLTLPRDRYHVGMDAIYEVDALLRLVLEYALAHDSPAAILGLRGIAVRALEVTSVAMSIFGDDDVCDTKRMLAVLEGRRFASPCAQEITP